MKHSTNNIIKAVALSGLLYSASSLALPTLQLGIEGGYYNGNPGDGSCDVETTCTTSDSFTLYALLGSSGRRSGMVGDTFRISAAIAPKIATTGDYGSFTFDGNTIKVTDDMVLGAPPIDTLTNGASDPGDLQTHGIFDTYYTEFEFMFDMSKAVSAFNVQDEAGKLISDYTIHRGDELGTNYLHYVAFAVDVAGLSSDYSVHFDLYNTQMCDQATIKNGGSCTVIGDVDTDLFAPFSHDAQSGNGGDDGSTTPTAVPEPSLVTLFGLGLLGVSLSAIRKRKAA